MANTTTTSGFDQLAQTYYNETAQDRLVANFVFYNFVTKKKIPKNSGLTFQSYRFNNISGSTTSIAEDTLTAGQVQMSAITASVTLVPYGQFVTISNFAIATQRTDLLNAAVDVLADAASDSVDQLTRNNLSTNAGQRIVGGKTAGQVLNSDIMTTSELKYLYRTLSNNKVRQFRDGRAYIYVCNPYTEFDLVSDDTVGGFLQTNQYSNPEQILENEIGKLAGFRIVVTPQVLTSSVVTGLTNPVYNNFAFGENAQIAVDLDQNPIEIIVNEPGSGGTADPFRNIGTVSYKLPAFAVLYVGSDGPRAYNHIVVDSL